MNMENTSLEVLWDFYHDYAINALWRKLPSFIDWQINVWRRILWAAYHLVWAKQWKAPAKLLSIQWATLWQLHSTWDASVSWAATLLWQSFVHRYPLIDWYWTNYGSLFEPSAAAARYLSASTAKIAEDFLLEWTNEVTVPFVDSYNWKTREPIYLNAKVPFYLLQYSIDIAPWYKGQRVSHNLHDLSNSFIHYIKHKKAPMKKLVELLKWPDFANWWEVLNSVEEMCEFYEVWKWTFTTRWTYKYEVDEDWYRFVITSIPQWTWVNKLFEEISWLLENKVSKDIIHVQDESTWEDEDWRAIVRIVIHWKNKKSLDNIKSLLINKTSFQNKANRINFLWFDKTLKPQAFWLREIYKEFLDFRLESKKKEFEAELEQCNYDLEIQEWFSLVVDKIDEVIAIIRKSEWREDAKEKLMKKFKLTEIQADKIGSRNLFSLTKTDAILIEEKIEELSLRIKEIKRILKWWEEIMEDVIIEEIQNLLKKYEYKRYTLINTNTEEREVDFEEAPAVQNRTIYVWISNTWFINYIDWVNIKNEEDSFNEVKEAISFWDKSKLSLVVKASLLSEIVLVSDKWWIYNLPCIEIPSDKRWIPLQSLLSSMWANETVNFVRDKQNYWKKTSLRLISIWENWNWLVVPELESHQIKMKSYKVTLTDEKVFNEEITEDTEWVILLASNDKYIYLEADAFVERQNWWWWAKAMWLSDWEKVVDMLLVKAWEKKAEIWWYKIKLDTIREKWFMSRWNKWIYL